MDSIFSSSAAVAAASAGARSTAESNIATALAAKLLLAELERGHAVNAQTLRTAMTAGFGRSDPEGAWDWKTGYDAREAAQVLFLRRFGPAMRARAGSAPIRRFRQAAMPVLPTLGGSPRRAFFY